MTAKDYFKETTGLEATKDNALMVARGGWGNRVRRFYNYHVAVLNLDTREGWEGYIQRFKMSQPC